MTRPKLLVSVRSVAEAEGALTGGADLIDVKEPSRGPMGMADSEVIREIVQAVDGKRPVSAALGEWRDWTRSDFPQGLSFVKWGLSGFGKSAGDGRSPRHALVCITLEQTRWAPVLVAYADHRRNESPDPEWLAEQAVYYHFPAFLLDTGVKDGTSLREWLAPAELARIRFRLADAGVPVAFAGSLDEASIRELLPLAPDWFAVRGAACDGGRNGMVSTDRVRRLKSLIETATPAG